MDLGIELSEKTDDLKDIDEMVKKIDEVVSEYGFKVSQYASWDKFRKACVVEEDFMKKWRIKYRVEIEENMFVSTKKEELK